MLRPNSAESSTESPPRSEKVDPRLGLPNNNNETSVNICQLCSRAFDSTQALGGHQNAHRRECNHELAKYIRHRLEIITKIDGKNFEIGDPSNRSTKESDNEAESVSLELTLAVGGDKGAGESGDMNYNYPDVLFPASEFMDNTVDLDLKL